MTLKTRMAANFQSVFGRVDQFGELVTYQAAHGGPARSVRACCVMERDANAPIDIGEEEREELWVQVAKDSTSTRGGVDDPQLNDTILRAGDPADAPWAFQGPIRHETPHSWQLLFGRNRPRRYGNRQ